jgi:putative transposase
LWVREQGPAELRALLSTWPAPRPRHWAEHVRQPQTEAELTAVRISIQRVSPFGYAYLTIDTARRLCLQSTLRPRGRPKKPE